MVTIIRRERRRIGRFRLEVPTKIEVISSDLDKKTHDLLTSNISSGGAFFHTTQPLPEGTPVKIDIILPLDKLKELKDDHKQAYVKVTGRVLRSESTGMAISFNEHYTIRPWKGRPDKEAPVRRSSV
ncbi:MAG: PilZ domain-containing protein [Deltaproteobacteria bacterium]|nr:MAG: PilZ domain-containing protein [Deltaproteobacteria bacterium]